MEALPPAAGTHKAIGGDVGDEVTGVELVELDVVAVSVFLHFFLGFMVEDLGV